MKKTIAKLGMLAVLCGVYATLQHSVARASTTNNEKACCTSGGATCCGSVCQAGGGGCQAN